MIHLSYLWKHSNVAPLHVGYSGEKTKAVMNILLRACKGSQASSRTLDQRKSKKAKSLKYRCLAEDVPAYRAVVEMYWVDQLAEILHQLSMGLLQKSFLVSNLRQKCLNKESLLTILHRTQN